MTTVLQSNIITLKAEYRGGLIAGKLYFIINKDSYFWPETLDFASVVISVTMVTTYLKENVTLPTSWCEIQAKAGHVL